MFPQTGSPKGGPTCCAPRWDPNGMSLKGGLDIGGSPREVSKRHPWDVTKWDCTRVFPKCVPPGGLLQGGSQKRFLSRGFAHGFTAKGVPPRWAPKSCPTVLPARIVTQGWSPKLFPQRWSHNGVRQRWSQKLSCQKWPQRAFPQRIPRGSHR
jgi:hypothetical protein